MQYIKSQTSFKSLGSNAKSQWIKEELPSIVDGSLWEDEDFSPEDAGYLVVFDEADNLAQLPSDFPYKLEDLVNPSKWEWGKRHEELDAWLGVIVSGNQFGLSFYLPSKVMAAGLELLAKKKKQEAKTVAFVHKGFDKLICQIIQENAYSQKACILNFRDPNYGADCGGFHPVEIMVHANGDYSYITDFSYMGIGDFAELEKELDWDFGEEAFYQMGRPMDFVDSAALFHTWASNFLAYYQMGVFNVEVTGA